MSKKSAVCIDDGQKMKIQLCSFHGEYVLIDFYRLAKNIQTLLEAEHKRVLYITFVNYFEDNEHELLTDYFEKKITLNDFSIADIIDIEDAFEDYLSKVYCKNI